MQTLSRRNKRISNQMQTSPMTLSSPANNNFMNEIRNTANKNDEPKKGNEKKEPNAFKKSVGFSKILF